MNSMLIWPLEHLSALLEIQSVSYESIIMPVCV
uniref:Uncharacterized protein n=1 Tax=Arundo donax TaxID=35708 RepID=A0A0A8Y660_ARUDO